MDAATLLPLTAKDGAKFSGQSLAFAIENSLYTPRDWPELARGLGLLAGAHGLHAFRSWGRR